MLSELEGGGMILWIVQCLNINFRAIDRYKADHFGSAL